MKKTDLKYLKLKEIRVDGYKNLINCTVPIGDFNVIVGPNNSGKSNLLEVLTGLLWVLYWGDDELRKSIFKGFTLRGGDSSICHLHTHQNKPMHIGITFEQTIETNKWIVDFDVIVKCSTKERTIVGFEKEYLMAKIIGTPGAKTTYLKREDKKLIIMGKEYPIEKEKPSLQVLTALYPEYKDLPNELENFIRCINFVAMANAFAISPDGLRHEIGKGKRTGSIIISSFDLLLEIEKIHEDKKRYDLFKETVCDILDLEDFVFSSFNLPIKSESEKAEKESVQQVRFCHIKRHGSELADIREFSDGTFAVTAILASLFHEENQNPIVFIEEIENCLHPVAVERLLRFLQDNAYQWPVVITTHSPYVVNGVKPEDIIIAVVDEDGATHFEKITNKRALNKRLRESYFSFGDLMANNFEEVLG